MLYLLLINALPFPFFVAGDRVFSCWSVYWRKPDWLLILYTHTHAIWHTSAHARTPHSWDLWSNGIGRNSTLNYIWLTQRGKVSYWEFLDYNIPRFVLFWNRQELNHKARSKRIHKFRFTISTSSNWSEQIISIFLKRSEKAGIDSVPKRNTAVLMN